MGQSVTGGSSGASYDKVVIMLHGGGESGNMWRYQYDQGWFGNMTGMKYVFPTSPISSHVWFNTYKNGCGLKDDCAYDIPSIDALGARSALKVERTEQGMTHTLSQADYICYQSTCYSKPGQGTMDKATCDRTCASPAPSGSKDYLCYMGQCYKKPFSGTMDQATCQKTCHNTSLVNTLV